MAYSIATIAKRVQSVYRDKVCCSDEFIAITNSAGIAPTVYTIPFFALPARLVL